MTTTTTRPSTLTVSYRQDFRIYKTVMQRVVVSATLLLVVAFPLVGGIRQLDLATQIMLALPAAVALNLLTGVAGLVSLGTIAFVAVGAFTSAALGSQMGAPFLLSLVVGTVVSALLGVLVGLPALRLRGLYLVVATMAFHFIVIFAAHRFQDPRVGVAGFRLPRVELGSLVMTDKAWYLFLTALAALSTIAFVNLLRSSWGRAWMMIREREIAAEVLGINVTKYKLMAFALSSAVTGFSGVMFAYYLRVVEVESFHLDRSIDYVAIIIIGGLGTMRGAGLGAILVFGVPFAIDSLSIALPRDSWLAGFLGFEIFNINSILYGLAIILFLLFEPKGLESIWNRVKRWFKLYPFSRVN